MTREQRVRAFAAHLGLVTRGARGGPFKLAERYDRKRELGTYDTVTALERAVESALRRMHRALRGRAS